MSSLNKLLLIGRVGRDPEIRHLPNGGSVANFSVATSERSKDKSGNVQERTEWHNCVAFGKLADVIAEWIKKGALIYVEGKVRTEKWQDKDGSDRYATKVYLDQMQMLGGKKAEQQDEVAPARAPVSVDADEDVPF